MNEERDVCDAQSVASDANATDRAQVRELTRAGVALRLASDEIENLSPEEAITRTRREAKLFRKWKESKAPISEILVRLSRGREIEVKKTFLTDLCGFYFVRKFVAGEVIYIYKKADAYFAEVELLSVCVDDIGPEGYVYEKKYENGQTVRCTVQHFAEGQLHVSVDYSLLKGRAAGAGTHVHSWAPVIAPILLNLSTWWGRTSRGAVWSPRRVFAYSLFLLLVSLAGLHATRGGLGVFSHTVTLPAGVNVEQAKAPDTGGPAAEPARQVNLAGRGVKDETSAQNANEVALRQTVRDLTEKLEKLSKAREATPTTAAASRAAGGNSRSATAPTSCEVRSLKAGSQGWDAARGGETPAPTERSDAGRARAGDKRVARAPQPAPQAAKRPLAIYVKAYVEGDALLTASIEEAFVSALKKANWLTVLTEDDEPRGIPKDALYVDLGFTKKEGCRGTISADLYADPLTRLWSDERDCHDYPNGNIVKQASQQLAKVMTEELKAMKGGDGKNKNG